MTADATVNIIKALDKDIIVDSSMILFRMGYYVKRMPYFIQKLIGALASCFTKEALPDSFTTGDEIWAGVARRDKLLLEYLKEMDEMDLDLILTPASLVPAPDKECFGEVIPSAVRPYIPWNNLNMPAGIVPITKVSEQDDKDLESLPSNDLFYKFMKQRCKKSVGLPLGIQIVGRRFQEELILALMTELEQVSNKNTAA